MGGHSRAFKRTGNLLVFGLALAVSAGTAFAHDALSQPSTQGLTKRLHDLHARYRQSDPSTQPQDLESLKLLAKSRKQTLAALMETDPGEVLRQSVPAAVRASLPADVQADIEEETDLEGVVEILHEDWPGGGRYRHFLDTQKRRFSLHFAGELPNLLTGDHVRVRGVRVEKALALDSSSGSSSIQMLSVALPNTFGVQKIVMILVNFQDEPIQPYTTAFAKSALFTTTSGFYQENSYGQTSLTGDVFGWFTIPMSSTMCSDYNKVANLARNAATAAGVNVSAYSRYVYAFPLSPCGWGGLGTVGGSPSQAWINGRPDLQVLGHELGHNFGLYHSHALDCGTVVVGPSCILGEYADRLDIMGTSTYHFNAFQKWRLGWLGYGVSPPITTVQSSGAYTIDAYESPGTSPKALKIPRGTTGSWLYVEARRAIGFDSGVSSSPSVLNGVVVRQASDADPNSSMLLDMNAATSNWSEFPLQVGQSFTDPYSPVTITTLSASGTGAVVNVDMGSGPTCTPSRPTVTATPSQSPTVQAGTTVLYMVSVMNNDRDPCTASTFGLQATAPSGWQGVFTAPSLTVAPGATGTTTLQVTSAPGPAGAYTIVVTAVNSSTPTDSGATSATYNLAGSPGTGGGGGTFTDDFNRAALGSNWQIIQGALSIVNNEFRNAASAGLHAAVVPSLAGAGQRASASFATTFQGTGAPTLGLILRYKDPKNYYLLYRLVGGASVLRIARVVNGVTTVLASTSIANPQVNILFPTTATASGSKLTFTVGTRTVSATDTTFASGSVGLLMGATNAPFSHRANNFSATIQ